MKSTRTIIAWFCLLISFMTLFLSVGYAAVADTMIMIGELSYKYEGVYITSVVLQSASNLDSETFSEVFPTSLKNSVTVKEKGASTDEITVTYKISFCNTSSRYKYAYKGIVCSDSLDGYNNDLYSETKANNKFTVSLTDENGNEFAEGNAIEPEAEGFFYATYTFGEDVPKDTLSFFLNYKFGVHIDSMGAMAVEKTMGMFLDVLNTQEDYENLITKIDDKYAGADWQANYIGNVDNVTAQGKADTAVVEGLLGSSLSLTIDDITKNVTVLIKREDLDGKRTTGDAYKAVQTEIQTNNNGTWWNPNDDYEEEVIVSTTYGSGCEMSIYMTPNNLDKIIDAGEYAGDSGWAEVYIAISTCENDGSIDNNDGTTNITSDWYQIGDIYEGIADIVKYNGDPGTGSFVTDHWVSTRKIYKVTQNYSYTIEANRTIKEIICDVDVNAHKEYSRLLDLANDAIAYIDSNESYFNLEEYKQPVSTLRKVTEKANGMNVNGDTQRSSLIPILKELENATYPFLDFISSES